MARRTIQWTEEVARVWWKWGRDAPTSAPFPGVRRAWFAFLRDWALYTTDAVYRAVCDRGEHMPCPLPQYLRIVVPAPPPAPHVGRTHAMHGAASILAPPARMRGAGQHAAMTV